MVVQWLNKNKVEENNRDNRREKTELKRVLKSLYLEEAGKT